MDSLVTTEWLAGELGASDLRVIDASFFLLADDRDGRAEHEAEHIPGAVFLDIETISDKDSGLPHTMPPEHLFASRMQSLGLGDGNRFVVSRLDAQGRPETVPITVGIMTLEHLEVKSGLEEGDKILPAAEAP